MNKLIGFLVPERETSTLVKECSHLLVRCSFQSQSHVSYYLDNVKVLIVKLMKHCPLLRLGFRPDLNM